MHLNNLHQTWSHPEIKGIWEEDMKRTIYVLAVFVLFVSALSAQTMRTAKSTSVNAESQSSADLAVASGTTVAGKLQESLDVRKAKVGDQVILKTTSAVKQDGQVVIDKGSKLIGHVTEVQKKAKGSSNSSIGVVFDKLQQGGNEFPINAMITSVIQATTAASVSSGDDFFASGSGSGGSTTTASGGGGLLGGTGGVLGGVTSTVSGATNTTVNTVGGATNVVGGVTNTVAANGVATTNIVSGPLRGLSITNSTAASAQGGSTLSMAGKDLRLEKGATFNLALSSSTSVEKN